MPKFLKELLGDKFKEDATVAEISTLVAEKYNTILAERNSYKSASDKNASEAADYKKKYTEKLTEAEKKELEYQELVTKNQALVRESNLSKLTAQYIALGYAADLAKDTANAQLDNNFDKVFENQRIQAAKVEADYQKKLLDKQPTPPAGTGSTMTKEAFNKLGYAERVKLYEENPTLYAELTK